MADNEQVTAAKKKLAEEKAAREKTNKEVAKAASEIKPTPTQEECDLAAMGVYLEEHEADGSVSPDAPQNKALEAGKPKAGYTTKSA